MIDQALVRLYSALIKLGYFDPASATPYRSLGFGDVATPDSRALALKAAEEGMVLLKNDGTLPLSLPTDHNTTIAMIGSWANATTQMQGNYFGIAPFLHSPLFAAQQLDNVNVVYATGVSGQGDPTTGSWQQALSAASQADIIIVADGISTSDESEGNDRDLIDWTGAQIDMIGEYAMMGKPMILAHFGDQLDDSRFLSNPNISAIIWGGYPGMAGGDALMNLITGKVAPAGRLPVTQYPGHYVQDVDMTDMSLRPNSTSGNPGRTYKWYSEPILPFGYGLHYTNFSVALSSQSNSSYDISSLTSNCTESYMDLCPFASFSVNVTNTGKTTSDYVALGFIGGQYGPQPYPLKSLVAYERLFNVSSGSSSMANLNLTLGSLARYDDNGNQILFPGSYSLMIDTPTKATLNFTLTGSSVVLDQWPQASS